MTKMIQLRTMAVDPRGDEEIMVCSTKFGEIRVGKKSSIAKLLQADPDEFEKMVNFSAEQEQKADAIIALRNASL